jgi:hypothetical protein
MKNRKLGMIFWMALMVPFIGNAQKYWDGEANDGKWNTDQNWFPDGVPKMTDDVVLNNNFVVTNYTVSLPNDNVSILLNSLRVIGNGTTTTTLEIPDLNTASPALTLNNIIIGEGGVLINNSGATAGNTFLINGGMRIEDGGKYSHRTIRGNAYLISKLSYNPSNKNGVIEFDVPGTAGYTVSLSGRSFGTLILNANKAGGKKTYSGSGIGNLTIYGNIETGIGATLTSSLNGNIMLYGNLTNHGTISLNPSTQDVSGREIIFTGDSCHFFSDGIFQQNTFFRKMKIEKNARLQLKSPLSISNAKTAFEVSSAAYFYPDSSYISGGNFIADSLSTIRVSSPDGISSLPNTGNIRSNSYSFHPSVCIIFDKAGNQTNGNAFPEKVAKMTINKPNGHLILNKGFHINDSLNLSRGRIYSTSENMISLTGKIINNNSNQYGMFIGHDESYVSGPMKIVTDTARSLVFPIGKDDVFAPVSIYKNTADSATYVLEYFKDKSDKTDSLKEYPLKKINQIEYWSFQKNTGADALNSKEVLTLSRRQNSLTGLIQQPVIANFSDVEKKWIRIPQTINGLTQHSLTGISTSLKNGFITFGELETQALPFNKFMLTYSINLTASTLNWTNSNDVETDYYRLEQSEDGKIFHPMARINSYKMKSPFTYNYPFTKNEFEGLFLRLLAFDKFERAKTSNTIYIKGINASTTLYPNPADDKIFLTMKDRGELTKFSILSSDGKSFNPVYSKERESYCINISKLSPGVYFLIYENSFVKECKMFFKR